MSVSQPQNPTTTTTTTTQPQNPQPSSLYVGDLSPDVTDRVLLEFFAGQGATGVIGGRVCRNSNTKKSLGYGYVNFASNKDADDAMEACNTVPLLGRPVRIMWSNRDPSVRRSGVGNIFIKNLDSTVDHRELHDTFSQFGNILSCKIQLDEQGKSKGYGFVHFETVEAAEKAIATVHGLQIKSQQVYVGRFLPKRERQRQHENTWTNVYVKPLPESFDEAKLEALFKTYGDITSVCIKSPHTSSKDVASFTPTKFGFVNFKSNTEAKEAVTKLNGLEIEGNVLVCVRAMKKNEREAAKSTEKEKRHMDKTTQSQGSNLYVKHLDENITKDALLEMFGKFGKITSVHLVKDQNTGTSKGVGYVCYSNPSEAQAAINGLHGVSGPSSKPLYVALHEPKHVRTQRVLAMQHSQRSKMPNQYMRGPYSYNGPRQPRQGGFPQGGNYQGGYAQPSYGQQTMGNQYMGGQPKPQGGPKKGGSQQDHALANRTYQLAFNYIQSIQGDTTVASKLVGAVLKKAGGDQAILSDDAKLTEVIQNAYNSYMAMVQQQQAQAQQN